MAYFYFDFRDVDKQKLQNLLPSLHGHVYNRVGRERHGMDRSEQKVG
jgi:hypothetical protein